MKKINIAELLKDCPKGTKLYSPLCGECEFDSIRGECINTYKRDFDRYVTFNHFGQHCSYSNDSECLLFPSKENRDWSTFQRPFKDGDIITCTNGICTFVAIYKDMYDEYSFNRYVCLTLNERMRFSPDTTYSDFTYPRLATEEEKQKLFDAIKANGYKWNDETKTLEKLIEPKFKVGDKVKKNKDYISGIVTDIYDDSFKVTYDGGGCCYVQFYYQHEWELVPNKFDITTLKPFDKVLVRNTNGHVWTANLFSHVLCSIPRLPITFVCISCCPNQCIPYESNEHLLGTSTDCDEYFKTWE